MLRSMVSGVLLVFAVLALVSGSATAVQKGGKGGKGDKADKADKVVAKWDWTVTNEKDKFIEKGTWIVKGYEIYNGKNRKVGKYQDVDKTHVKLEVFEGRLTGKFDLEKEKESSSEWKGELELPKKAGTYKITAVFEKSK